MVNVDIKNIINCSSLSGGEINHKVKELISSKSYKTIILKNTHGENNVLEGLKGPAKIEVIGNVGNFFANDSSGLNVIVNGNIGDNSGVSVTNCKIMVMGSCGANFACNAKNSEFYILDDCGKSCFANLVSSKVVIAGQAGNDLANSLSGGIIAVLILRGGNIFIDDNLNWLQNYKSGSLYIRGDCKISTSKLLVEKAHDHDEDIYLPLISEFARLYKYSLSEIKSKPFYKITAGNRG